ncbi:MAG: exo-alpha-sialidase [Acidobacteria bacterium]|nr:exo-alpha-sialidase [Acidobacteriota bacterium]
MAMSKCSRVFIGVGAFSAFVTAGALTAQQPVTPAGLITVGPNVQVSSPRGKYAHYELLAGAHLTDPNKLMACSMMVSPQHNASNSVVYTSIDGGRTWKETLEVHDAPSTAGDPVCPYGLGDNAYFVVLTTKDPSKMLVYRSSDAGLTWSQPTRLPFIDRENLVVDVTGGKYNGRVYINGTGSTPRIETGSKNGIFVFRSTDGGVSFEPPLVRQSAEKENVVGMGNSVVLSDGTLVTLFGHNKDNTTSEGRENRPNQANSWLRVVTSADGGETLSTGIVVSDWFMDRARSQGSHIPWLAVDPGSAAFKDRLYAVWNDSRSERLDVLLSYSSDKGKTWSKPVDVSDDRIADDPAEQGPDQIMPLVAVNKKGVVGVAWYDRREHKDNLGWWFRFAASLDGGETFLPSVRVSNVANNFGGSEIWPVKTSVSGGGEPLRAGAPAPPSARPLAVRVAVDNFFFSSGHTSGFVADAGGTFHPIWTDNRTGLSQLWTAPVTVASEAVRNGSKDLAALDDVTAKVTLDVTDTTYDRSTKTVVMRARLKNTSKDTVHGPVNVRVIALQSDVGVPTIVNATNGAAGLGAVWDFSPLVKSGELKPDEVSDPLELRFRLDDVRALRQGQRSRFGLVNLDAKVLGHLVKAPPTSQ